MRSDLVPPGWPPEVLPPQAPDWERSAVAWLYDLCPPDYRSHEVLRRHPVLLARFAAGHVRSAVEAARDGIRTARAELRDVVPPEAVEAAIDPDKSGERAELYRDPDVGVGTEQARWERSPGPSSDPGQRPGPLDPGENDPDTPTGFASFERPGEDGNWEDAERGH